MHNHSKSIGTLVAVSILAAANASAEVEYTLHTGYSSEYLFRGINLGDDLIEAGADVVTEWNGLGVSAGAWYGSIQQAPTPGNVSYDELDLYGKVSKDVGFATVTVGYIWYVFPDNALFQTEDAQEACFSVSREFMGTNASATYFWDTETDNDGYSELALSKSFELTPCLTLNTGATAGYLFEEGDFAHLTAKISLDWAFTETATLSPYVAHS